MALSLVLPRIVVIIHPRMAVEDKICTGTECEEIKSSTSDKEDIQVDGKGTVLSTTSGTN